MEIMKETQTATPMVTLMSMGITKEIQTVIPMEIQTAIPMSMETVMVIPM